MEVEKENNLCLNIEERKENRRNWFEMLAKMAKVNLKATEKNSKPHLLIKKRGGMQYENNKELTIQQWVRDIKKKSIKLWKIIK